MSSRVYKRIYSNTYAGKMGAAAIAIPAGDFAVVAIPFPPSGRITGLVVEQTGGTNVAFTVDLLDSATPFAAGNYAVGTSPASPIDLYRILAQQSASAGNVVSYRSDTGQAYRNVDGDPTNVQRYLYLVITPTGAGGSTTWDASITTREEEW